MTRRLIPASDIEIYCRVETVDIDVVKTVVVNNASSTPSA